MAQDKYGYGGAADDRDRRVKGSEVFVGGLPRSTTENNIHEIFSVFGKIVEIRMMKDQDGISKGFCFVRYSTKEAATKALKEKNGTMLHGKKIGVSHSSDQDSLFFGNLPKAWTPEEFEKLVRQAFREVVSVDLALPSSTGNSHLEKRHVNRGFAFVRFSSHGAAARAQRLGSKPDFLLSDWHPSVDWAEKDTEIDPEELAKVTTAFVGNLPTNADEELLKILFEPFGKIEKVALSRKGHFPVGFVQFVNRSDLNKAIKEMDSKMVQGPKRGPTFKIQVSVARPVEKDRKRVGEALNTSGARLDLSYDQGSREALDHSSYDRRPRESLDRKSYDRRLHEPLDHKSKAPRLANVVTEPVDPYEEAVISLPSTVKERLLRILRLGVATRYDVDLRCIESLQVLPEQAAKSVLDQFLLSGGDKRDKAAYFASLVARQHVDKVGSKRKALHLPLKGCDFSTKEPEPYSLRGSAHSETIDSTVSRYASSAGLYHYPSRPRDDHLLSRPSLASSDETAYRELSSSTLGRGRDTGSRAFLHTALNPSTDHLSERPQMRFDPFTGQRYKFDPFTGEAIRPESHSRPSSHF